MTGYIEYETYCVGPGDEKNTMKKALGETQTLRRGCSKAEPKNFAMLHTPYRGGGTAKI